MSEESLGSRRIPFLTRFQWLIVAAAIGISWLIWPVSNAHVDRGGSRNGDGDEDPVVVGLDNLRTVEAVARLGPEGLPELVAALANPNFRFRRNALLALRSMGPVAVESLDLVRERLVDEDSQTRLIAIEAYWHIRRDPDDVAANVAPLLGDRDTDVRAAAAQALQSIGPPAVGAIVEMLQTGAPAGRIPALISLRRIGWDESKPQIDDVLRNLAGDPEAREQALWTLATWGHPTPSEIRDLLRSRAVSRGPYDWRAEWGPRETALGAIIRQSPDAENLNDVVDLLFESPHGGEQWNLVIASLRAMKSGARSAGPRLLQFMDEHRDYRRIDVGWVYWDMGGDPREVARMTVPLLLEKDTDLCFHAGRLCASASPDEARRQVSRLIPLLAPEKLTKGFVPLMAIWGLAPEAEEAIPALSRLLNCEKPGVPSVAAKALGDIGPKAEVAIPELLAQFARGPHAHNEPTRCAFCEAIGKMGPLARSAVPTLLAELREAPLSTSSVQGSNMVNQRVVEDSLLALVRIGDADPAVLSEIRRLANYNMPAQLSAVRALERLTPDSPEVLSCYLKWLRDHRGAESRVGVAPAISRLPAGRQEAVTTLSRLLTEGDPETQKAAAWSLGKLGPDASAALPALRELLGEWRNSLYSYQNRRSSRLTPVADNPRLELDRRRWIDREDVINSKMNELLLSEKSVADVVRTAITEIEAGLSESLPSAIHE